MLTDAGFIEPRHFTTEDLPALVRLHRLAFPGVPCCARYFVRQAARPGRHIKIFINEHGQAVGFMIFDVRAVYARLRKIGVHPHCRQRGIATKAIRWLADPLFPLHRERIVAAVAGTDTLAQRLLRAAGLRCARIERRPDQPDRYHFGWQRRTPALTAASARR